MNANKIYQLLYLLLMGFWKNVEERRNYLGLTRKDLALQAGIKYAAIGAGLERDSIPAANTALRLAKALHIPLENLLDDDFSTTSSQNEISNIIKKEFLINKYWNVIEDLELIPKNTRQTILEMIHKLSLEEKNSHKNEPATATAQATVHA